MRTTALLAIILIAIGIVAFWVSRDYLPDQWVMGTYINK